jgi:hypothetical protein
VENEPKSMLRKERNRGIQENRIMDTSISFPLAGIYPLYRFSGLRQDANSQQGKHQEDHRNNQEQTK